MNDQRPGKRERLAEPTSDETPLVGPAASVLIPPLILQPLPYLFPIINKVCLVLFGNLSRRYHHRPKSNQKNRASQVAPAPGEHPSNPSHKKASPRPTALSLASHSRNHHCFHTSPPITDPYPVPHHSQSSAWHQALTRYKRPIQDSVALNLHRPPATSRTHLFNHLPFILFTLSFQPPPTCRFPIPFTSNAYSHSNSLTIATHSASPPPPQFSHVIVAIRQRQATFIDFCERLDGLHIRRPLQSWASPLPQFCRLRSLVSASF
ncbi:hypothetical protein T439DRAFT_53529 [Meredithblackwellia eburnea MCA 4105]